MPDIDSIKAPDPTTMFQGRSVTAFKEKSLGPATAEDLVDASGRCARMFAAAEPGAALNAGAPADPSQAQAMPAPVPAAPAPGMPAQIVPQAAGMQPAGMQPASVPPADQPAMAPQQVMVPTIPAAVALGMTECDVAMRAGLADRVEIGANARSERTATLTVLRGPRPGIYHFADGRLKSMERAPAPPEPPKPARKKRTKPKRTVAR
jgi:hypothetical protein